MRSRWSWLLPSAEIVTVGLPFAVFKVLTGAILASATPIGYALVAWGAVDALLNAVNLAALVAARRRVSGVCLTEIVVRRGGGAADLGLAIDVFLSFALVAVVIGFGLLARVPAAALPAWNAAVVLNVLGAGIGRLLAAVRRTA